MRRLILCEKFYVAMDVANAIGSGTDKPVQEDWWFQVGGTRISWFDGHLVGLVEPEEYNKDWEDREIFPVLPDKLIVQPLHPGAARHVEKLRGLVGWADEVVNACDAGREGELIFRLFWEYIGEPKKPLKRLWFNDNTPSGIKAAFGVLKDGNSPELLAMARAARLRAESDWLLGINGSRAVSKLVGGRQWVVGRVQTAILFLLYQREKDIREFISRPYFSLYPRFNGKDMYEGKIQVPEEFRKLGKFGHVFAVEQEALAAEHLVKMTSYSKWAVKDDKRYSHVFPFPLFDLKSLQRFCAIQLGWSSTRTIKAAQDAYAQDKTISYPRTNSSFLPESFRTMVPSLYQKLWSHLVSEIPSFDAVDTPDVLLEADAKHISPFNSDKVDDHYAIIPTGVIPTQPTQPARLDKSGKTLKPPPVPDSLLLWRVVARRFLLYFMTPAVTETLHRETTIEFPLPASFLQHRKGEIFPLKAVTNVENLKFPGWTLFAPLMGHPIPKTLPPERKFPTDEPSGVQLDKLEFYQGFTDPPEPFDEDRLLGHLDVFDLGTPATQASIIESLVDRGYVARAEGKPPKLKITKEGSLLISALLEKKIPFITSPELTGQWEQEFEKMERGAADAITAEDFSRTIRNTVIDICHVCNDDKLNVHCPVSGRLVTETDRGFIFPGFPLPFPKTIAGRKMTAMEYKDILSSKRGVGPFSGFVSRAGKNFDAKLVYKTDLGKVAFQFR